MKLSNKELRTLYQSIIQVSGHPDPMGLMARILLLTEGDPNYMDAKGRLGMLPLYPEQGMSVQIQDVQSMEGNLMAAIALDKQYFANYGTIKDMVIATHSQDQGKLPPEYKDLWKHYAQGKELANNIIFPRLATVMDVIKLMTHNPKLNKLFLTAFTQLSAGKY